MREPKSSYFFHDLRIQLLLRLRLLLRDRLTCVVFMITTIIFLVVLNSLNLKAEERSSIPVGVADLDQSELSKELQKRLQEIDALYIHSGSYDELEPLLLDGYINSIYVIQEGYGEKIKTGDALDLIMVYSGQDDKTSAVIGDLFAGQMIYDICLYRGYLKHYSTLPGAGYSFLEYEKAASLLSKDESFAFKFDLELMNLNQGLKEETSLSNALLYRQMIAGMVAMLFSFVVFFSFAQLVLEKEQGILKRRRINLQTPFAQFAGNLFAVLMICFALILVVALSTGLTVSKDHPGDFMKVFFGAFGRCCLYVLVMGIVMLLLGRISSSVFRYQILGSVVVLGFGVLGFLSIFQGFMPKAITVALQWLPNSRFIMGFTELLR